MPRPAQPLLTPATIAAAALAIIDAEGLEAFSLKRLARDMEVQAPSLYHHFPDKASILEEVARAIVLETPRPRERNPEDWIEYLVAQSLNFRRTVLRHAHAAPVLLQFMPRDVLAPVYEVSARLLADAGVPAHLHVLVLDALDRFTLGAALTEAMKRPGARREIFPNVEPAEEPAMARAVAANRLTPETLWAESIRTFLRGIDV